MDKTVRLKNLFAIESLLDQLGLFFWLSNYTLLYAYKAKTLSSLPFDDISLWSFDYQKVKEEFSNKLEEIGFRIIKKNAAQIIIEKNKYQIILNIHRRKDNNCIGNEIIFPVKYFKSFDSLTFFEKKFNIPTETNDYLEFVFTPTIGQLFVRFIRSHFLPTLSPKNYYRKIYYFLLKKNLNLVNTIRFFLRLKVLKTAHLTLDEFKDIEFTKNSFDLLFRRKHLDLITNNNKNIKVGEIISYFKEVGKLEKTMKMVDETMTDTKFNEPIYYSRNFWQSGNNFFFYSMFFSFRKNVISYEKSNNYIRNNVQPYLYSKEYYENRKEMNELEITKLLNKHPIEISNNSFGSGRHRVAAMIGRIIKGKSYIPIKVYYI